MHTVYDDYSIIRPQSSVPQNSFSYRKSLDSKGWAAVLPDQGFNSTGSHIVFFDISLKIEIPLTNLAILLPKLHFAKASFFATKHNLPEQTFAKTECIQAKFAETKRWINELCKIETQSKHASK